MEELINQAFAHIDGVGPHVREGHYDLEGPEGELILKNIWSTTVQPGWQITMKMWPQLDLHPVRGQGGPGGQPAFRFPPNLPPEHRAAFLHQQQQRMAAQQQQNANARGHHGHRVQQPPPGMRMGMNMPPMAGQQRVPVPPAGVRVPMFPAAQGQQPGPQIEVLNVRKEGRKSRDKKKTTALNWFGGRTVASSSKR